MPLSVAALAFKLMISVGTEFGIRTSGGGSREISRKEARDVALSRDVIFEIPAETYGRHCAENPEEQPKEAPSCEP